MALSIWPQTALTPSAPLPLTTLPGRKRQGRAHRRPSGNHAKPGGRWRGSARGPAGL